MPGDVTQILSAYDSGDPKAAEELLPLVYEELRKMAASKMANERPGQTLQATALVHEAWLRLAGSDQRQWRGRSHFFGAAAEAMRRVLIDKARQKASLKLGQDQPMDELHESAIEYTAPTDEMLAVHEALDALAVSGTNLYAAGDFTAAGNVAAHNIAMWNGSSWSALDSGIDSLYLLSHVTALAVSGSHLYAGGGFSVAGGKVAGGIAKARINGVCLEPVSPHQPGAFQFLVRGDAGLSVRVQRSANLRDWEDWQALTLGATPSELSDLDAGAVSHRFYRAVTP